MKIGYVYKGTDSDYFLEQVAALKALECDDFFISNTNLKVAIHENEDLKKMLQRGKSFYIYEMASSMCNFTALKSIVDKLDYQNVELQILKPTMGNITFNPDGHRDFIMSMAEYEHKIISERTSKGLTQARERGVIGGRPRISTDLADKIYQMYTKEHYSFRRIADECEVSLGTVFKYVHSMKDSTD